MRLKRWGSILLVSVLFTALFASSVLAAAMTVGNTAAKAGGSGGGAGGTSTVKADDSFVQVFYDYEDGSESRLWGPTIDWNGQYYYLKKNPSRTVSYIFQNYAPDNKTTPFITIYGNVSAFEVTSDPNASYVYYQLEDEDAMYRLPLVRGASDPTEKVFSFDGTDFSFQSFTLAKDPEQFFLYSEADANLEVSIGLFSFDGDRTPIRTWTATLPQEWKDNFQSLAGESGYDITFEASTGKIWLLADGTFHLDNGSLYNAKWWFFSGSISRSEELVSYWPSDEIPGWGRGNFKSLWIQRYGRLIEEHDGDSPGTILSLREFDPASGQLKAETLTTWKDKNGTERPLGDFFSGSGSESGGVFWRSYTIDGQGNLYLYYNHVFASGLGNWQRIAVFAPQASQIGTPIPDPSATGVFGPDNIVLKSSRPSMPTGTTIIGSRWEIYDAGTYALVYAGTNDNTDTSHAVDDTLPIGDYRWRVAYDWTRSGGTVVDGSTKWSAEASISVATYTVRFETGTDSYIPDQIVPARGLVTRPADPTDSGWIFVGWFEDEYLEYPWEFYSDAVYSDMTLYAGWVREESSSGGGCDTFGLGLGIFALASGVLLRKG
ncbi:MAG: InlB B-repeat-containing protein, partial [Synergistaceae bacterium]|nr:InlB B-repeat-containing protein [Synergistaceae bacterium]